ncbi:unnamed protein product [Sphacelaria rigidula]
MCTDLSIFSLLSSPQPVFLSCCEQVGYTGIACRCNYVFCSLHRYPEQHSCDFDFKTADRNDLKRTVVGGGQFSKVDRL